MLQLPSPDGQDQQSFLTAAVSASSATANGALMSVGEISSMALQLNEDIGLGAISKAGALPYGDNMGWVKFAEDKIKRDAKIDHQSLMWELGSSIVEAEQSSQEGKGEGFNAAHEQALLDNMTKWFVKNGGVLKYGIIIHIQISVYFLF